MRATCPGDICLPHPLQAGRPPPTSRTRATSKRSSRALGCWLAQTPTQPTLHGVWHAPKTAQSLNPRSRLSTDMHDSKFYDPSSRKTPRTRPRPRQRLHLPRRGGPAGLRQHAVCDAPRRPAPRRLALLRRRTATRPMSARAFGTRQLVAAGASPRLCTVSECEESCNQI